MRVKNMEEDKNKKTNNNDGKVLEIIGGCCEGVGIAMLLGGMIFSVVSSDQFMIGFIICICSMGFLFLGSFFLAAYKRKKGLTNITNSTIKNRIIDMSENNPSNYKPDDYEKVIKDTKNEEQMVCQKCGHINDAGAIYCEACGQCLVKKCACGAANDADAEYCKKCGKKL